MWRENHVVGGGHGDGVKHIRHPIAGPIAFEYSAFAVDGRPDLSMTVYNPVSPADAERMRSLSETAATAAGRPQDEIVTSPVVP